MKPTPSLPVIFTAFANPHGDLANLSREQHNIQDALAPLEAEGRLKHVHRTDTDLDAYFNSLQQWKNRLAIFHYAGHANSESLSLQNAPTFFEPLAEELMARNPDSLKLVFLNGCSTHAHVETLFKLGAPAVIASSVSIDDGQAMQLATRFYENLAKGDSITDAYKSAARFVKGSSRQARFRDLGEVCSWQERGPLLRSSEPVRDFPWALYVREEGVLPEGGLFGATGKQAVEELESLQNKHIQMADKIYNIDKIDQATFN